MSDPIDGPIPDAMAALFQHAVIAADGWLVARAPTIVIPGGHKIDEICRMVAGYADDMPEHIVIRLKDMALDLNVPLATDDSYSEGARCLLAIHRRLELRYPTVPR